VSATWGSAASSFHNGPAEQGSDRGDDHALPPRSQADRAPGAIGAASAQGNLEAKAGGVAAFISQVRAQTGKSITAAHAALLIQLVSAL
jgi:hypothetical protein